MYNKYIKENYMGTNIRTGAVTGSGAVLDTLSSVTVADTRIRSIYYSGVGTFLITGSQTDENGSTSGSNIKFVGTTNASGVVSFSAGSNETFTVVVSLGINLNSYVSILNGN